MAGPRRNPKRKATESKGNLDLNEDERIPPNLIEESLKPFTKNEMEEWQGWVELESNPAMFNIILRDLGIEDVKACDVMGTENGSIDTVPRPIYGFIFLFRYVQNQEDAQETEEDAADIWFANQTVQNACGTVALVNILMNTGDVDIGPQLEQFKASTRDLSTPLRGYLLSKNAAIRKAHNSFGRRMDHLSADLVLENDFSDSTNKKSKKSRKSNARGRKKARKEEAAYHYVAYIPSKNTVWELDGLDEKPIRVGPTKGNGWTEVALERIRSRMESNGDLNVSVLALYRNPIKSLRDQISEGISRVRYIDKSIYQGNGPDIRDEADIMERIDQDNLAEFGLTLKLVEEKPVETEFLHTIPTMDQQALQKLRSDTVADVKEAMDKYTNMIPLEQEEGRQHEEARKTDYSLAIHTWITKLAEKGVLQDLIGMSS